MNVKKITITNDKDEEYYFKIDSPTIITMHMGAETIIDPVTNMVTKKPNGNKLLVILSGPANVIDYLNPDTDDVENLLNT